MHLQAEILTDLPLRSAVLKNSVMTPYIHIHREDLCILMSRNTDQYTLEVSSADELCNGAIHSRTSGRVVCTYEQKR